MIDSYIQNYLAEVKQICDIVSIEQIKRFADIVAACKKNSGRAFFLGEMLMLNLASIWDLGIRVVHDWTTLQV